MGTYIQIGACTDVSVNKAAMAGHRFWQLEVIVSGLRPAWPRRQVSSASHGSLVFESHSKPMVVSLSSPHPVSLLTHGWGAPGQQRCPAAHRVPLHGKLVLGVVGA